MCKVRKTSASRSGHFNPDADSFEAAEFLPKPHEDRVDFVVGVVQVAYVVDHWASMQNKEFCPDSPFVVRPGVSQWRIEIE